MAKKSVSFNKKSIETLFDDKPVVCKIQTENGKNNYTGDVHRVRIGVVHRARVQDLSGSKDHVPRAKRQYEEHTLPSKFINRGTGTEGYLDTLIPKSIVKSPRYGSIEELKNLYAIDNENIDSLKNFMDKNNNLNNILKDVFEKIHNVFGKVIKELYLEHFIDPEEDFQRIYIKVITDLSIDDKLKLRDEFYDRYWLDQDDDVRRLVSVMV
jgi:hypothetical protein